MKVNFLRRSAAAVLGVMILVLLPAAPAFALDATSTSPSALGQGVSNFDVTVLGSGFLPTDTVSFSPSTGITINSTTFVDTGHITVNRIGVVRGQLFGLLIGGRVQRKRCFLQRCLEGRW